MRIHLIWLILLFFIFSINCEKQHSGKRKIKLITNGKYYKVSNYNNEKTTVLKLDSEKKRSIAILTFENHTGDKSLDWLSQGIADMLIYDLSQSNFLNVISMPRILDILKNMKIQSHKTIDYDMLSKIANEAQVEAVIKGNFLNVMDSLIIIMHLYSTDLKMILKEEKVSGQGLEQVFSMVDELSKKVKTDLRVSLKEASEQDFNIADISTKSLEAYKYYTEGFDLVYKAYLGDAIKKLNQAIKIDSSFAMAHFWASLIYLKLGKTNDAYTSINKAVKFSKHATQKEKMKIQWIQASCWNEHEKAFNLLIDFVKIYPNDKEMRYFLASTYYARRDIEKAQEQLKFTLQLDPNYIQAYMLQSELFREKGDYDSAIKYLKKCIALKPDEAAPYHNLGMIYESKADYKKALKYFNKAISIKPDFHFSILSLAYIYSSLGKYDEARKKYVSALKILPSEELKARVYSGLAKIDLSQGKYNMAISHMKEALKYPSSNEGRASYLTMLANIYFQKEMYDSTITVTSMSIAGWRENLSARIMKAQASRGGQFGTMRIWRPDQLARTYLPLIVPLFLSAFRRAEELVMAMEARCYVSGAKRTRFVVLTARPVDHAVVAGSFAILLIMVFYPFPPIRELLAPFGIRGL